MGVIVEDLTVEYVSGDYVLRPLDSVSMGAEDGELVLLLGASGCGKTSLLSALAGILTPTSGRIVVGSTEVTALRGDALVRYRREAVGVVFQAFNLVPSLSAAENVQAPLRLARVPTRTAKARAAELLDRVGLADRAGHRPSEMSGGQQQRVAIARALAHDPPVLLADEPTAHLDYVQCEAVLTLLRELAAGGRTVIVSTHDDRLLPLADRVLELTPRFEAAGATGSERHLEPGEVLFRQGDASDVVYLVEEGELEVVRELVGGAQRLLGHVGPGGYVGELGPLLGLQRSATARASTPCTVRSVSPQAFRARVGNAAVDDAPTGAGRQSERRAAE